VLIAAISLSGGIADQIWPKANGVGYVVTHIVVRGVLGGAIGVVLIAVAAAIEVGIVRNCGRQPQLRTGQAARPLELRVQRETWPGRCQS
jgi:hypothetical protein